MDVTSYDPMNKLIYSADAMSFDDQVFPADMPGNYLFCFKSNYVAAILDFDITVSVDDDWGAFRGATLAGAGPSAQKLGKFEESLRRLKSDLKTIQTYQRYFKLRDTRNSRTVDATRSLIPWFCIIESLLIMFVAYGQVKVLKRFFTKSNKVRI